MNDTTIYQIDDAVEALDALHRALTYDLDALEARIRAAKLAFSDDAANEVRITSDDDARALLHSGLASIAEVLGWFQLKTEEDPEGDIAVALQPLPTLPGCSIH